MSRRFIYIVPLMEKEERLVDLYVLCVPNGNEEFLVDLYLLCVPERKRRVARRFISIVCP